MGPDPIPHAVGQPNAVVINHLGPTMNRVVEGVKELTRYAFQTNAEHVLGVAGPASAANEMAISNLVWPGRRCSRWSPERSAHALRKWPAAWARTSRSCVRGRSSGHCGASAQPWQRVLRPRDPRAGRDLLRRRTTRSPDRPPRARTRRTRARGRRLHAVHHAAAHGRVGNRRHRDGWPEGPREHPGVSLIAISDRAWEVVEARPRPMPHWCLDAVRAWRFWDDHQYHYTAPVPGILAVYEPFVSSQRRRSRRGSPATSDAQQRAGVRARGDGPADAHPRRAPAVERAVDLPPRPRRRRRAEGAHGRRLRGGDRRRIRARHRPDRPDGAMPRPSSGACTPSGESPARGLPGGRGCRHGSLSSGLQDGVDR